jgi:RND superfamily putative drug exporter
MLVALVVLPTVLRLLGPRIDALTPHRWRDPKRLARPSGLWRSLGNLVTNRPIPVATIVLLLTIAVATPISRVRWTTVDARSLPASAHANQADRVINRSTEFIANSGTPFYLALKAPPTAGASAVALTDRTRRLGGVLAVARPRYLGKDTWRIDLIAAQRPYSAATQNVVRELSGLEHRYQVFVGGDAASFRDERSAIAARLPLALALLAVATLIILFLLTGSLVAPLLALLMNALTLAAAFGALVLIFQDGRFEGLLGYTSQSALDLTIPLVLAALVFAISTDYGVFLLSRVREARLEGDGDRDAIRSSVARVGRIVSSAALLFAVSIGVFGTSNIVVLKILGIGTALAVLADAVLVRCLLFPAVLRLLGHRTWWLPPVLARLHQRSGLHEGAAAESR